ncbi:MAG: acyl dehydratase [Chloroflexi bacterium]|nr:acyl dehydratase [Chloroflexota bacterium]
MTQAQNDPPVLVKEVTQAQIERYARVSGDLNPIHLDPGYAATTPFGRTIAHGMLVVGFISELMTRRFGRSWLESGQLRVRFKGPAYPGDRLTIAAVVRERVSLGAQERVGFGVSCRNQGNGEIVVGEASLVLSRESHQEHHDD